MKTNVMIRRGVAISGHLVVMRASVIATVISQRDEKCHHQGHVGDFKVGEAETAPCIETTLNKHLRIIQLIYLD